MNRTTGLSLNAVEHLRQSIGDILTTPIGSRVMRRDYGSLLPELIDQPLNGVTVTRLYAATAAALIRWEPRIRLSRLAFTFGNDPASAVLDIEATRTDNNESLSLAVPLKLGASA